MDDHVNPAEAFTRSDAETFLFHEARLLDAHDYEAWLALWTEDAEYWIPADGEAVDPRTRVSLVFDNRARLGLRVKQLQTGHRYAQLPRSRTQHYVSNVDVEPRGASVLIRSSYLVIETRFGEMHLWPGRAEHELVLDHATGPRMRRKTVVLVNNDLPITTMAFLV